MFTEMFKLSSFVQHRSIQALTKQVSRVQKSSEVKQIRDKAVNRKCNPSLIGKQMRHKKGVQGKPWPTSGFHFRP